MTRKEVLAQYDVTPFGCIVSPGPFECEPLYAPYLWDRAMNGFADEYDGKAFTFFITDEDRREFPELIGVSRVDIYQRSDGFICTESWPR